MRLAVFGGLHTIQAVVQFQRNDLSADDLKQSYPFYHTSDELHMKLQEVVEKCKIASLESFPATSATYNTTIDVVTLRDPAAKPVNKVFMLFGEHARELISPESALHFIQSVCGMTDVDVSSALRLSEFKIIVNGNPGSRREVEAGDYCLRVNPAGVDLNRNWDEKWEPAAVLDADDTNPGAAAFSEAETKVFRDLVSEYRPSLFLTVHSGTKGMYQPWAHDMVHKAERNGVQMLNVLKKLDEKFCQCPFGAAGKEVGYPCPGTCLDWVYDQLKCPYTYAFEIYTSKDNVESEQLTERFKKAMSSQFLQKDAVHNLASDPFKKLFEDNPSHFVQLKSKRHHSGFNCFTQFNPTTQEDYTATVNNWSQAYAKMADMVAADLQNGVVAS